MKYIDAEKLKAEINRLKGLLNLPLCECLTKDYKAGGNKQLDLLFSFIDSLQQEQLPGIEDPGIPGKDFIPVDWVDACEKYGKWKIVKVK